MMTFSGMPMSDVPYPFRYFQTYFSLFWSCFCTSGWALTGIFGNILQENKLCYEFSFFCEVKDVLGSLLAQKAHPAKSILSLEEATCEFTIFAGVFEYPAEPDDRCSDKAGTLFSVLYLKSQIDCAFRESLSRECLKRPWPRKEAFFRNVSTTFRKNLEFAH